VSFVVSPWWNAVFDAFEDTREAVVGCMSRPNASLISSQAARRGFGCYSDYQCIHNGEIS